MNRQWRKNGISLLIIVIIMALLTSACGSGASKGESSSDNTSGDDQPVKLSIFIASRATDEMYTNETLVWKEIGKKFNVEFDFITGDAKTMRDKFPLMISSNEYPDIVADAPSNFNKYGPQGVFIPLNDLIKDKPNLQKYLVDDKIAKSQIVNADGNIYGVPMLSAVRTSEGPLIRQDWLDRLNLPVPETMDDWYNTLKAFKEKDANGNGDPKDEVPFSTAGTFYLNFADAWGIDLNEDGRWMEENGKMIYTPIDPRAKEFLTTMNKWYSEGLFDQEILSRQDKDYTSMVFNDKVGATNHWVGYVASFNARPEVENIKGFNFQVTPPPVMNKGDKPLTSRQQQIVVPVAWAISGQNEHVDKTMEIFEYAYSDEGQLLFNFGVEGDTYTKEADGTLKYTDKIMKNPDGAAKALSRIGAQPWIGFRQDARYEKAAAVSEDAAKQLFHYVEQNYFRDPVPALKYTEDDFETSTEIKTQIDTYVNEMISKFIIGQEPLSQFEAFAEKVRSMRFDELEAIQNKAYEANKELMK
ncbi:sugar ABC transporter permease [Paenibacillus lautus]|uniref:extracellular solute-binding protein n=1 Tax=Paenibacillus lautus TaxID=1401 RepID=UPI001B240E9D|nr:extracellular solute-binding protein [Paenibacillus lautus]GIO95134.1 sugar ABC transporter permease [Paenibacillus lautus]